MRKYWRWTSTGMVLSIISGSHSLANSQNFLNGSESPSSHTDGIEESADESTDSER